MEEEILKGTAETPVEKSVKKGGTNSKNVEPETATTENDVEKVQSEDNTLEILKLLAGSLQAQNTKIVAQRELIEKQQKEIGAQRKEIDGDREELEKLKEQVAKSEKLISESNLDLEKATEDIKSQKEQIKRTQDLTHLGFFVLIVMVATLLISAVRENKTSIIYQVAPPSYEKGLFTPFRKGN